MVWIYFVLLSIFVIGSEASQNRFFDMKYGERFRTIRPIVIGEANYSRQYDCSINKGLEYIFEFSNKEVSSSLPARITVESISSNRSYPVLIVVRQQKGVLSWQLPLVVEIQSTTFEYVRTSRTLCPDNNYYMPYHTNGGNSNDVVVSLSTASPVNVSFSLRVNLERDFLLSGGHSGFGYITYITKCTSKHHCTQPCDILPEPTGCLSLSGAIPGLLKDISGVKSKDNLSHSVPSLTALVFIESIAKQFMRELRNISVSPAEPRYYSFKFEDDVETVVLRVDSNDDICMTVSIQNMSCPVFDLERNVQFEGYWQTMNRRGGITLTRSAFPMGFYVVFVVKGDDADCSGLFETVTTTRNKTITFSVSRSIGYQKYIISTIGALTVFVLFYVFSIVISIMYFIRCRGQVSETGLLDDASFVSPLSPPPTSYDQIQTPSRSSEVTSPRLPRRHSDSSLDETDIDMLHDADSDKDVFRMFGIKSEEKEVEDAETDVSFVEITPILDEGSSAVEFSLPQHQRCAAHLLNLIATKDSQKAEEDAIFKKIARSSFALCQALWNKQRSTVATDSVHEKFQKLLVTPNATRWNSMYNSVKCLVSVVETSGSAELDALMDSLGLQHFRPSQLTFLKEYIVIDDGIPPLVVFCTVGLVFLTISSDKPNSIKMLHCLTKTVLTVMDLARKDPRILRKKSQLYVWNLLTVAVFYSLPVVQLVITYQLVLNQTGNQDLCYYNFLCAHPLGLLSDFNHIFSNIGYVLLGLLFIFLTYRRDLMHHKAGPTLDKLYGIPQHYGLFYAMGAALIMEGILSGCYHVCPNHSNFQFDTSFMYVISMMCMLKIYQTRHPDINASAYSTFGVLALVILVGMSGVLWGTTYFWVIFTIIHLVTCVVLSAQIYYMGRWKLDLGIFKRIFTTTYHDLRASPWHCITPVYPNRMVLLILGNVCNWALAVLGLLYHLKDFATYLLTIFMANLLLYVMFYIVMKLCHGEKILPQPLIYILLSFVSWGAALYFFLNKSISWALTPAQSRSYNQPCEILDFYDKHDIWHFLSAASMFFSFMVLLTLDDDLVFVHRSKIPVF